MVTVELSKKDAATLRDVLGSARTELRTDGSRNDAEEFLAELAEREKLVDDIIEVLEKSEEETQGG